VRSITLAVPIRKALHHIRQDMRRVRTPGSFARNIFDVFSGNSLGMLSQVLLTPIIARLYGPEAYGLYGLFIAVMMNIAAFGDLGYSSAYVLPKEEDRFIDLVRLNMVLLLFVAVAFSTFAFFPDQLFQVLPGCRPLGDRVHLAAPLAVCYTLSVMGTQWLTRAKEFKRSAFTGATIEVSLRILNLAYGLIAKARLNGLILCEVIVRAGIIPLYAFGLRDHGLHRLGSDWNLARLKEIAIAYKRYPLLVFPERWVSLIGMQIPIFFLANDLTVVGHYSLGASLLLMPLRLLGFSMSTVYMQKASEVAHDHPSELKRLTHGLYKRLFWIGIGPFLALIFFSDLAFALVFGEPWRQAGLVTAALGGFFFFRLLTEPLVSIFNIQRREQVMLVFQISLSAARLIGVYCALQLGYGALAVILIYGLIGMLGYTVLSIMILNSTQLNGLAITLRSAFVFLSLAACLGALRLALTGPWWP